MSNQRKDITTELCLEEAAAGLMTREIAEKHGCAYRTVRRRLNEAGLMNVPPALKPCVARYILKERRIWRAP